MVLKVDGWGDGQSRCEAVKQWGTVEGQYWTSQGSAPESFTPVCYNLQKTHSPPQQGHRRDGE